MKTILLSTSCLWNCGDDFIRNGVLSLLNPKPDVRTIWWNRAHGVTPTFANDIAVNVRHCDYFVVAGTPTWINKTEYIYKHCLKHDIPISLIGVGTRGAIWHPGQKRLLRDLAASGLIEICLVRDKHALTTLQEYGFGDVRLILDPAFFVPPLPGSGDMNVLGWRDYAVPEKIATRDRLKRVFEGMTGCGRVMRSLGKWYDSFMLDVFNRLPSPKRVVVHDNREIARAESLFGKDHVFYSTDYREIFRVYSSARMYVGSRIHGAIPSFVHGACVNVFYLADKAFTIENARDILSGHIEGIEDSMNVVYIKNRDVRFPEDCVQAIPDRSTIQAAIGGEKETIQKVLKRTSALSTYLQ